MIIKPHSSTEIRNTLSFSSDLFANPSMSGNEIKVDILLSTFNGEQFLQQQLDSLVRQNYTNWNLIVRDDGSSDSTVAILESFMKEHDSKVHIIRDGLHLDVAESFLKLLRLSKNPYILFCDQDDIWHPDKINTLLTLMLKTESGRVDIPVCAFSKAELIDQLNIPMKIVVPDIHRFNINTKPTAFFFANYVPGCCLMLNSKVRVLADLFDCKGLYHDHFCIIITAILGKLAFCPNSLISYRIHEKNTVGYRRIKLNFRDRLFLIKAQFKRILSNNKYRDLYSTYLSLIKSVYSFGANEYLIGEWGKVIKMYSNINNLTFFARKYLIIKYPPIIFRDWQKRVMFLFCF